MLSSINPRSYAAQLAAAYDRGACQYRNDDEIEARSENHRRIGGNLRRICRSFGRPIRVLEVGCGTGRYFHWLENVRLLVGTDLSAEMLKQARRPVRAEEIHIGEIRLQAGNIYEMRFTPGAFDFIYCLGMFGYGAALTVELGRNLHAWLSPGGRLYFNAIEVTSDEKRDRLKKTLKSYLPRGIQARLDARPKGVPVFRHTRHLVEQTLAACGFVDFTLSSNHCPSPLWSGVHLECHARRNAAADALADNLDAA